MDDNLRRLERGHRARMWATRACANRQGHVGNARLDGQYAGNQDWTSTSRREHGLGTLTNGSHLARNPLPPY